MRTWRTAWRKLTKAAGIPGFAFQEAHQLVVGPISSGSDAQWLCARERLLLQTQIRVEIHLCGLDRFMPQPESNHRAVHSMLKKVHGCRVAQHGWADFFPPERWAIFRSECRVFGDEALDRITTELSATDTGKQRIFRATAAFAQPSLQHLCRFRTQRRAPVFSALPLAVDMSASAQNDILAAQADQLGNAKPGLGS